MKAHYYPSLSMDTEGPMNLYLMRHGIALDVGENGIRRDADRPLSEEGRRRVKCIAEGLRGLMDRPDLVVASPLLRARQTAEIVARQWGSAADPAVCESLAPHGSAEDFFSWLQRVLPRNVLAVGHMPDLSDLASVLLFGRAGAGFDFRKGSVAAFGCESRPRPGRFHMRWFLPPRIFRRLGESDPP